MNKFGTLAVLTLAALSVPSAKGALQLSYQITGGVATVCGSGADTGPVTCSFTENGVAVDVFAGRSNSPGTPGLAQEFGTTLEIRNESGADRTLTLWIAAQNFTAPTTPPGITFASSLSATQTLGSSTSNLTSCVDTGNDLAPPTDSFCSAGYSITNTPVSLTGTFSGANTSSTFIGSLGSPYSLSQQITVVLAAGTNMNVNTSNILTPIPEPASVALFGSLLVATGLALRKKRAQQG